MARTVEEIKSVLTNSFISNETIIRTYQLEPDRTFEEQFSRVSIESIIFYVVAFGMHILERIFDTHRSEVNHTIENIIPHRPKWYRDKALNFMKDMVLIDETDRYDTTGMTEDEIAAAKIVTHAAAVERDGFLEVKIATGQPGVGTAGLGPIPNGENNTSDYQTAFEAYMNEIRDAGVRVEVINEKGDHFECELRVFYNSILLTTNVETDVKNAIKNYLQGLPFNGEYSNMALVDAVQVVDGVRIVTLRKASTGTSPNREIADKITPRAGYFEFKEENITLEMIPYATE